MMPPASFTSPITQPDVISCTSLNNTQGLSLATGFQTTLVCPVLPPNLARIAAQLQETLPPHQHVLQWAIVSVEPLPSEGFKLHLEGTLQATEPA